MSKRLDRYRKKRDFEATPEPAGGPDDEQPGGRFVIQEHHARSMHWDLRLEHDGVLLSWAVPRGIPPDPKRNNLAVHTEDHPLEYLEFEGDIPRGEYGGGSMRIWDRGRYEAHKMNDDEAIVTLHGDRVRGRYALFQTDGNNWMIHRMDPPEDPDREAMPKHIEPMLATLSKSLPRDEDNYGFEVKWDGVRSIAYVDGGRARFESRRGGDITSRYPELRGLGPALGSTAAVLDGEIVAFEGERPSFERLQRRMHVSNERAVRRLMGEVPVVYVIFDLLWLEGHSTLALPYRERRKLLDELAPQGPSWQTPAAHEGGGTALLDATKRLGLEGVVAKRLESVYETGRRSRAWLKVKNHNSQEFVIGGWAQGKGARSTSLGALLIGYYESAEPDARLRYAGRVGTGLTEDELRRLVELLEPLRRDTSPFTPVPRVKDAVFVEPELVAEVEFTEWTSSLPGFSALKTNGAIDSWCVTGQSGRPSTCTISSISTTGFIPARPPVSRYWWSVAVPLSPVDRSRPTSPWFAMFFMNDAAFAVPLAMSRVVGVFGMSRKIWPQDLSLPSSLGFFSALSFLNSPTAPAPFFSRGRFFCS